MHGGTCSSLAPGSWLVLAAMLLSIEVPACKSTSNTRMGQPVVTIRPSQGEVVVTGTLQFAGAIAGAADTALSWSVQEQAGCGSVIQSGLYTAPGAAATCHVAVTSHADPSATATATVTVSDLAVSPNPASVALGTTQQFTVSPAAAVSWSVTDVPAATPAAYSYPLKVSADGRYLVDQNGVPWRVQAEAAWFLSAKATPDQVDTYLADRKAKGFNSLYLMAMVHPGGYPAAVPNAPNDYAGDPPFATPGVFSTAGGSAASQRYWAWIDTIIDKAAAQNMVVMFAYTYLGYQGGSQGWWNEVLSQPSRQACTDWGTWLGNRYKGKSNLVWFTTGDYTPPTGSEGEARTLAIANAIKAAGATQLFMSEMSNPDTVPTVDAPAFASILDMNSFYGYGPGGNTCVYQTADRAYRVSPARPAWMQEGTYEYENNTGQFSGQPWDTRRGRLWSVLAGGTAGDGFGSRDVYQLYNFPSCLSSPGASYSTYAFQLFASLPWWNLRPSGTALGFAGRNLIVSGGGTWGQQDYVTSAATSDGSFLLAYIPTTGATGARTVTVDATAMSGPYRARWFNPATGSYTDIGSGLANSGVHSFTSQADNGTGTNDWVLVLDVPAVSPCGTISSTGVYTAPSTLPTTAGCWVQATLQSNPAISARAAVALR